MKHSNIYLVVVLVAIVAFTGCTDNDNQNLDNPLVGTWEIDIPASDDYGYEATWRINNDRSYNLDFRSGSIAGGAQGYSNGRYILISDSIFIVHSFEHENLGYNYAFGYEDDTLFVERTDIILITIGVRLVGPSQYARYGDTFMWRKKI